jgi:hypothetical protein
MPVIRQDRCSDDERRSTTAHGGANEVEWKDNNGVRVRRVDGQDSLGKTALGVLRRHPRQNSIAHFTASLKALRSHSLAKGFVCSFYRKLYCCRPMRKR